MTVDTLKLRHAAIAVDIYNNVQKWIDEYSSNDLDISVSWHAAAACTGYKETAKAVETVVRNDISKILKRALEHVELAARRACTDAGIEFDQ